MTVSTSRDPARIAGMFDAIAWRYDRLNHLLSLGLDRVWRRRAIRELALADGDRVLDVCTGTGDLALEAVRKRGRDSFYVFRKKGTRRPYQSAFTASSTRFDSPW